MIVDTEIFFDPSHENFDKIYSLPDPEKDNLLKMISLKSINDAKNGFLALSAYSVLRFAVKRKSYFPKFIKYSRFMGTISFVSYMLLLSNKFRKSHEAVGLGEYKQKRHNFDKHTKIMKDIISSRHEMLQAKSKYEEGQVNIKKLISEQNNK